MAMNLASASGDDDLAPVAEINVTPLVDVMLVLLIIFMVTAPLLMVQVPLELPTAAAASVEKPKEPLVVSLNSEDEIYVGEDLVSEADLIARLSGLSKVDPSQTVFVRADRVIEYGKVMDLLATVGSTGFSKVSLMAEAPKG